MSAANPSSSSSRAERDFAGAGITGLLSRVAYRHDSGRDVRLDFLRGWCIFSMVVDHAAGQRSSPLFALTGNGPWPITGAHGFVLLSGCVMGILYAAVIARSGIRNAMVKVGGRAWKLYAVAVTLGLFGIAWGFMPWGDGAAVNAAELRDLFLLRSGTDDLMTFYFILVLIAVPVLIVCSRRLWPVALALSVAAWLIHNHDEALLNPPVTYFVPLADWQLFFVTGLLIGYHRRGIGSWLKGRVRGAWLALVLSIFALTVTIQSELLFHFIEEVPAWVSKLQDEGWQSYDHNPPIHMALVFGNLFALYYLVTWLWLPVERLLGWFFIPLGQAALYVYIVHTLLVYYALAAAPIFGALSGGFLTVALLGLMLLLWFLVKRRVLFAIIPR